MKAAASLTILGALASMASAAINPVDPWGESKWVPGSQVTIKWTDDKKPSISADSTFDIFLSTGGDQKHIHLQPAIATGVKAGTVDSITYTVPVVEPPGKIYFLVFNQTSGGSGQAYTTRFTITDPSGNPGTLAPSAPVGENPGGVGSIVTGSTSAPVATSTTGSASGTTSAPSSTGTNKPSSAVSLGASVMSVAAVVAGAIAMVAF